MDKANDQSWKWNEIIEPQKFSFEVTFSQEDYISLSKGSLPEEMEDKWFVFLSDDNVLRFIRSWTGITIFTLHLAPDGENYKCEEAFICNESWKAWKESEKTVQKELSSLISWMFDVKCDVKLKECNFSEEE